MAYKTSDRGLAAYLMLRGFYCIGTVPADKDTKRMYFVFDEVKDVDKLENSYLKREEVSISPLVYYDRIRSLGNMLRNPMTFEQYEKLRG